MTDEFGLISWKFTVTVGKAQVLPLTCAPVPSKPWQCDSEPGFTILGPWKWKWNSASINFILYTTRFGFSSPLGNLSISPLLRFSLMQEHICGLNFPILVHKMRPCNFFYQRGLFYYLSVNLKAVNNHLLVLQNWCMNLFLPMTHFFCQSNNVS